MFGFEKINTEYARKIRWIILSIILLGIIAVNITPVDIVLNLKDGNNIFYNRPTSCAVVNIFGIPCPLCGMSRGFHEISRLNFAGGVYYNPFSVIFYPLVFISITFIFTASLFNYKLIITKRGIFWWGVFVVFIIVWMANIIWGHH